MKMTTLSRELEMLYLSTPYMPLVWFSGIKFWLLSVVITANVSKSADFIIIISHELCVAIFECFGERCIKDHFCTGAYSVSS